MAECFAKAGMPLAYLKHLRLAGTVPAGIRGLSPDLKLHVVSR